MNEIGCLLGVGKEAEVFAFGELALKLYKPEVSKASSFREAAHLAVVERNGLSAPRVHAVNEYDGRWGVVMDRVQGPCLGDVMPSTDRMPMLNKMARLHRQIHACPGHGLTSMKSRLAANIRRASLLDDALRERLIRQLHDLPDGDCLCHGDFHPWNVIGDIVVDWLDACTGDPLADVCRTYVLSRHAAPELANDYVEAYVSEAGIKAHDVFAWLSPVAAARLAEGVPDEEAELLLLAGDINAGR
ncbi:aminoglycoside phosphotransferase family protein [Rhizobium sp. NZLR1]|uniref:phosphotransferase family protein n=1 Tax=Rhizobium sp. NZLR1 TaxID=2731096 RepID=UPI001A986BBE|nr:aminoglycoside phosphotransferase family protein [Rhizobium sp. NZLR1]MBX5205596.1 aminoglycoside phosphotransferase family protein [Rhizobium sp. NZLR1]QSZ22119.1 aminoglycoside phosphotransferase family protein [Rhizobium sp. NZLR1]